jgi:hypothetical protein
MKIKVFLSFLLLFAGFLGFSQENYRLSFAFADDFRSKIVKFQDSSGDASDDKAKDNIKDKYKIENPFKNIDWSFFNEKYRLERILIAAGTVTVAIGLPMFLVGLIEYLLPQTDKSSVGDITFICLMGVGGGLMVTGGTVALTGTIRWAVLGAVNKIEVSLSMNLK